MCNIMNIMNGQGWQVFARAEKPVAKTGNNRHSKNLVTKMAKTGKNYLG